MPMCNVTFIGINKYYQTAQAQNPWTTYTHCAILDLKARTLSVN